jgi:DNA-binding LacI/PurR family transcriptional regulator
MLAVEELGYVTNAAGRALQTRRAGAVALIVPNTSHHVLGHAYFMHVLTGVNEAALERSVQLVLATNADEQNGQAAYDRVLRSGSVDGAIVTSAAAADPGIEHLANSNLPVVLLGRYPHLPEAVSVWTDDVAGSQAATAHLVQQHGRRRLLHISGPLDHRSAIDRRDGFFLACRESGIEPMVLEGDYSEESGAAAVDRLAGAPVDGIVAANDEMAYGALRTLQARGISLPDQVSLIGYDDFGLSRVTTPGISTVHVPAGELARIAAEQLFLLLDGGHPVRSTTLPVHLELRQSCGC